MSLVTARRVVLGGVMGLLGSGCASDPVVVHSLSYSGAKGVVIGRAADRVSRDDVTVEREQTLRLDLRRGGLLAVEAPFASLEVRATDGEARARASFELTGPDRERMEAMLEEFSLELEDGEGRQTLRVEGEAQTFDPERPGFKAYPSVALVVEIPAATPFHAELRSGSMTVEGLSAGVDLDSGFGKIELREARGEVRVHSASGSISLRDVKASELDVESGFGALSLVEVESPQARLVTQSGKIAARDSSFDALVARSGFGTIELDEVARDLDVETGSGAITVNAAPRGGRIRAVSGFGNILVESARGDIELRSQSGSVTLRDGRGDAVLHSGFGRVAADGHFDRLEATSSSGAVEVEASMAEGDTPWRLESGFGAIRLELRGNANASLEASSGFGSVNFEGSLGRGSRADDDRRRATLGDGRRPVRLHSDSGPVRVSRSGSSRDV